jgi:hypothetical protein
MPSRCFTVTLIASRRKHTRAGTLLPSARGNHCASSQASFMPIRRSASHAASGIDLLALLDWMKKKFLCRQLRFQVRLFLLAFLSVALTRPLQRGCLAVPSKDYSHGQAPPTQPDFVKGDRPNTHSRAEKKRL